MSQSDSKVRGCKRCTMIPFLCIILIALALILTTCAITYEILRQVWRRLPHMTVAPQLRVLLVLMPIFAVHILNIWIYAVTYLLLEYAGGLGSLSGSVIAAGGSYESLIERLYFSATIYTSLGIGDIMPTRELRMLMSAEALNGLIVIGWTISFTYLAMEKFWLSSDEGSGKID